MKQSRPNINAATLPTAGPICIGEAADETFLEKHKKDKKEKHKKDKKANLM